MLPAIAPDHGFMPPDGRRVAAEVGKSRGELFESTVDHSLDFTQARTHQLVGGPIGLILETFANHLERAMNVVQVIGYIGAFCLFPQHGPELPPSRPTVKVNEDLDVTLLAPGRVDSTTPRT